MMTQFEQLLIKSLKETKSSMKYQLDCLRNEIDHITEDSVKHNNSPMTVHGQFQSIVKKIDRILDGKEEYTTPNGWKTEKETK